MTPSPFRRPRGRRFAVPAPLWLALLPGVLFAAPAAAQDIPRVKAQIDSFDGHTLKVSTEDGQNLSVDVLPATVYMYDVKKNFSDIAVGDFVGAAAAPGPDGKLRAEEVHIFPDDMRGEGEGHYPMGTGGGRTMTDATVTGVVAARAGTPGVLTLHYRGAGMSAGACSGHAPLPVAKGSAPPADVGGCAADLDIAVGRDVPVIALVKGDAKLLVPGAAILLFVATRPDGQKVTPGLSVEKDGFKPLI